jgi:hypothetical protein
MILRVRPICPPDIDVLWTEVDQQSRLDIRSRQIIDQLDFMRRCQLSHRLQFENECPVHEDVRNKIPDNVPVVEDAYWRLGVMCDAHLSQFDRQCLLVHRLEKSKAESVMNLESRFAESFSMRNRHSQKQDLKANRLSVWLAKVIDVWLALASAVVLWFGARLVLSGEM